MLSKCVLRLFSILCVLPTTCLYPHDLFLVPQTPQARPGGTAKVAIHNGDTFPESESAPVFSRLQDALIHAAKGTEPIQTPHQQRNLGIAEYAVPSGSYALSLRTVPVFVEIDATEFEEYLSEEQLNWAIRWRVDHREFASNGREVYSKYTKALVALEQDDFALKAIGLKAEIVLLANPARAKVGDKIPVQVLLDGKPVKEQPLQISWTHNGKAETRWVGRTDADGKLQVELESAGLWRLRTVIMQRYAEKKDADWESFWTSLTFRVGTSN